MNPGILTFNTPQSPTASVEAMPSPTLELAYTYYALRQKDSQQRASDRPWLAMMHAEQVDLVKAIKTFWDDPQDAEIGIELFAIVCDLGYARDADVTRLLHDFPQVPMQANQRMQTHLEELLRKHEPEKAAKEEKVLRALLEKLETLKQAKVRNRFIKLLQQLWHTLEPLWKEEGFAEAKRASEIFLAKYKKTGNVLDALPSHHFTQFEHLAQEIKLSQQKSKVLVTPLFFAAAGGFNFDFDEARYIGYGIQSEHIFEKLVTRVTQAAKGMKALGDPTRLMLLTLIARYGDFGMTVSDFAVQLSVSQPTVSGHLKLLKEADLVTLEKRGNKSFYKLNAEMLGEALGEVKDLLRLSS